MIVEAMVLRTYCTHTKSSISASWQMSLPAALTGCRVFGSDNYKVSTSGTNRLTTHFEQEADWLQTSAHRSLLIECNVMQVHHERSSAYMHVCGMWIFCIQPLVPRKVCVTVPCYTFTCFYSLSNDGDQQIKHNEITMEMICSLFADSCRWLSFADLQNFSETAIQI